MDIKAELRYYSYYTQLLFHRNLDDREIADASKVIDDFFSASWLPNHLRTLKIWRDDIMAGAKGKRKSSPSDLLYNQDLIVNLLEEAWLIKDGKLCKIRINKDDVDKIGNWYFKIERKKHGYYPKNLNIREMFNPNKVLRKIFRRFTLEQHLAIIKVWLHDAFSEIYMEESMEKAEVIIIYENLVRLFEAMWLIHIRTKEDHAC